MLAATVLSLIAAAATAAPAECPKAGREELLATSPSSLLPCEKSTEPLDWVWAAHAHKVAGENAAAAELYERAAKAKSLASIRSVLLIEAARSGLPDHGIELLDSIRDPSGWVKTELDMTLARLFIATKDWKAALRVAQPASEHARGEEAEELLTEVLVAAQRVPDRQAFLDAVRRADVELPWFDAVTAAEANTTAAPLIPALSLGDDAERWAHWTAHGGAASVARECVSILEGKRGALPEFGLARMECGRALATIRSDKAEPMLRAAAKDPAIRPAALFALAKLAGRHDKPEPVEAICAELAKTKSTSDMAECAFLAAFLHRKAGDKEGARKALEKVRKQFPTSPRAEDAAWFLAFDTLHSDDATPAFELLAKQARTPSDVAKATYWEAMSPFNVDEPDPEWLGSLWTKAEQSDPTGYYGWLSATRIGELYQVNPGECSPTPPQPAPPPKGAETTDLLLRAGFRHYANLELPRDMDLKKHASDWLQWLAYSGFWKRVADVGGMIGAQKNPADGSSLIHWAYPSAYPAEFAKAEPVDRCLMLALMRRESLFDPDATSPAQAVGLLQLLPVTAAKLAAELKLPAPRADQLHDPALNIRLGVHYVAKLMERFKNPLIAAAAFNAGPKSVAEWTKKYAGMPIDEWVENIPFRETRNYVKGVGAAFAQYHAIYGGSRPPVKFDPVEPAGDGIDY